MLIVYGLRFWKNDLYLVIGCILYVQAGFISVSADHNIVNLEVVRIYVVPVSCKQVKTRQRICGFAERNGGNFLQFEMNLVELPNNFD